MPPRTRKPTSPTATTSSNVTDLQRVQLNLDTWEDPDRVKEPFAVVVGGQRVVLKDPKDIDWQDLRVISQAGDPHLFFEYCFSEEDKTYFMEQRIEARKMNKLMEMYFRHYKIEMPEGNSIASST